MRFDEPVAGGGTAGRSAVRDDRGDGVDERPCRPAAARTRRWRSAVAWPSSRALVRRTAPAAWLGMRLPDGGTHRHDVLRRPVHPTRHRAPVVDRNRRARAQRSLPPPDGLLRARDQQRRDPGEAGAGEPAYAGMHARQCLAWGRRGTAARAGSGAGALASPISADGELTLPEDVVLETHFNLVTPGLPTAGLRTGQDETLAP